MSRTEASGGEAELTSRTRVAEGEPNSLVVDPLHRGDCTSVEEAIQIAEHGMRILICPGVYGIQKLVIDKPLEIVSNAPAGEVLLHADGCIVFDTAKAKLSKIAIQHSGWYEDALEIKNGRIDIEDCEVSSENGSCISIDGRSDVRLRCNRIHDGNGCGVKVDSGQAVLEDNDIFCNREAGIKVRSKATLSRNRIHNGGEDGVYIGEDAEAILENNEIFQNAQTGVKIEDVGIIMRMFERQKGRDGRPRGKAILRSNRITNNGGVGVAFSADLTYLFEGNVLRGNAGGAWDCFDKNILKQLRQAGNIEQ